LKTKAKIIERKTLPYFQLRRSSHDEYCLYQITAENPHPNTFDAAHSQLSFQNHRFPLVSDKQL